ncbi:hypothetical protein J5X84_44165 [Streptosporangiaceae bacterium NEAU-GS5]|nr:hypothetical protein [Streptosporangiaceae bacterium NEAU-GS5]
MVDFRITRRLRSIHFVGDGETTLFVPRQVNGYEINVRVTQAENDAGEVAILATVAANIAGKPILALEQLTEQLEAGDAISIHECPAHLRDLLLTIHDALDAACTTVVHMLRWRRQLNIPARPYTSSIFEYSMSDASWRQLHLPGRLTSSVALAGTLFSPKLESEISRLANQHERMPIGHELIIEASELAIESPRSALLLSVSALEVGFKRLVSQLVTHSEWLVTNVPTPPLSQMLRDYFPLLPVTNTVPGSTGHLRKSVLDSVTVMVRLRNELAHKGATNLSRERLHGWLRLVEQMLYLFDYYAGHEWALSKINVPYFFDLEGHPQGVISEKAYGPASVVELWKEETGSLSVQLHKSKKDE